MPFNILVVNDHSDDGTLKLLENLSRFSHLKFVSNEWNGGVGNAIRFGLTQWQGDIVAICMADGSDAPEDILLSYKMICLEGYDCVFGSRFIKGGQVEELSLCKIFLK
jgi:dolichol-phosphate mannosyltransferase